MCGYEGVKCEKTYRFEAFALLHVARQTLVVDHRRFGQYRSQVKG